jgi:hypothetical protein
LTLSVWANKKTSDLKLIGYWSTGGNRYILRETGGILQFYTYTSSQVGGDFGIGGSTGWHMYTAVYNGTTMMLYKDGIMDSTTFGQTGTIPVGSGGNLIIGAEYEASSPQMAD